LVLVNDLASIARDTAGFELVFQQSYRAEFGIAAEDATLFASDGVLRA
jgi:hypothetical protein